MCIVGASDRTSKTLGELVRAELPAGIANLPAETQAELARVVVQAKRIQAKQLEEAAYSMLDLVPGFLRGAVKKAAGV